ncbi:MAG: hypothetical protein AAGE52_19445 [Myxococcota bacterium]
MRLWGWVLVGACATTPRPVTEPRSEPTSETSPRLDAVALQEWTGPRSRTLFVEEARRVEAPPSEPRPPRRRDRVDVSFRRAPLSDALRFLADRAGINLVVEDNVQGEVSLQLRSIHPLDALEALAQAHGAQVSWRGNVAIVTQM